MHCHQPTNPEPVQEPIERIATVCGPSSFVLRPPSVHRPSSTVCRPGEYLFHRKKKQVFPPKQNLDTQPADAIISSGTIEPLPWAGAQK
jgi:hypothetical protein